VELTGPTHSLDNLTTSPSPAAPIIAWSPFTMRSVRGTFTEKSGNDFLGARAFILDLLHKVAADVARLDSTQFRSFVFKRHHRSGWTTQPAKQPADHSALSFQRGKAIPV
jgi:hypothetical protein